MRVSGSNVTAEDTAKVTISIYGDGDVIEFSQIV